jgi:short-subunit dehydrogenase
MNQKTITMNKSILIIGAGPGLSYAVAEKFASQGFSIGLISRYAEKLQSLKNELEAQGTTVTYAAADAGDAALLEETINTISASIGGFDVVFYNAAVIKARYILEESNEDIIREFAINVAGAVKSLQVTYESLKKRNGTFLLTSSNLAINPIAEYGSLSIGKAGLRSLAYQLHDRLKDEGIYVGMLTINGAIDPQSNTHSPAVLANLFWKLYSDRKEVEIQQ